ncbi:hypothetical protein CPT_Scapp_056 [Serratia phage Scapp]|uniref:Uncharacterized protein n=1 Tax=Serratia phage Scapp TaxID=2282409 RepID=A0A345L6T3_9CAUD|nr:hypothetical protein PP898_gp56 [Serratia phage Scapp]AXH50985.1 hypothetical protein CPT_Scapp_056 [Serratia phage Scapp]
MSKISLAVAVAAWRTLTAETVTVADLEANPATKGLPLADAVQAHIDSVLPTVSAPTLFAAYFSTRITDLTSTIGSAEGGDKILKRLAARLAKLGNTEAAVELLAQAAEEAGIAVKGGKVATASKKERKAEKKAKKARKADAEDEDAAPAPKAEKPKKEKSEKKAKKAEKKAKKGNSDFAERMAAARAKKAAAAKTED